jgi:hypothetical protein
LGHRGLVNETPNHHSQFHAAGEMHGLFVLLLRAKERQPAPFRSGPILPSSRNLQPAVDAEETVNVLLLTVFIGVVLVLFFVVMFLRDMADPRGSSERDALLPLAAEKPRPFGKGHENPPPRSQNPYDQ